MAGEDLEQLRSKRDQDRGILRHRIGNLLISTPLFLIGLGDLATGSYLLLNGDIVGLPVIVAGAVASVVLGSYSLNATLDFIDARANFKSSDNQVKQMLNLESMQRLQMDF